MMVLLDTNVLLRATNPDHDSNEIAIESIARLEETGRTPVLVPQCCFEYFVVATRPPGVNGLGLSADEATRSLDLLVGRYELLRDADELYDNWRLLVDAYDVRGKTAHDARFVAAMQTHGISNILTFNFGDFARYRDVITVLDPRAVVAGR
jgi:predicted nucleic acid-binding protein